MLRALLLDGLPQLLQVLWAQLEALVAARAATATELASKFVSEDGAHSLSFGDQKSFFGGLERLIGPPAPSAFEAMEREHTASSDSLNLFTSLNYGVTTTAQVEWWFVVEPERNEVWPVEAKLAGAPDKRRKPLASRQLDAAVAKINAKLDALGESLLLRVEGIGARLYTGPMCAHTVPRRPN